MNALLRGSGKAGRSALSAFTTNIQMRAIAVGTDLTKSSVTLQNARPWYMDDKSGSNLAKDNARSMKDLFSGKKVAMFGVPAPFTGTCTEEHVPPYKELADKFKEKGVDTLISYAVSCPYAQHGWAKAMDIDFDKMTFLADPDASFAKEFGLDLDLWETSLGIRSKRFSMVVEDGIVKSFNEVEDAPGDAAALLDQV